MDQNAKSSTQILALSPDNSEGVRKMVERVAKEFSAPPGFPLLADPEFKVVNRYGVFNPELFNGRKVPHPAVFVIDRAGRVTWKFLNTDARIRAEDRDILQELEKLEGK